MNESHLKAFADANVDAVAIHRNGIALDINTNFTHLFGYTREEMIGNNGLLLVITPESREAVLQHVRAGDEGPYEALMQHKNGTIFPAEINAREIVYKAEPARAVCIRDITARKEAEKQIEQLQVAKDTLYAAEQAARQASEQQADRLMRLQRVTSALGEALTIHDVARIAVEETSAATQASSTNFHLYYQEEAMFEMLLPPSNISPEQLSTWQRYPAHHDFPIAEAVRTREALWFESAEERNRRYPVMAQFSSASGASVLVPLVIGDRAVGALGLTFSMPRVFDEGERQLLLSIARQCAQALERVQLYESEQRNRIAAERQAERLKGLHGVAVKVSQALTIESVIEAVVERGFDLLGASRGALGLLTEDHSHLKVMAFSGFERHIQEQFAMLPMTSAVPMVDAVHTKQLIIIESAEAYEARYPELFAALSPLDKTHGLVCLPLSIQGHVLGSIGISFTKPSVFTTSDLEFMQILAKHCAEGLERVRLYEIEIQARIANDLAETNRRLQEEIAARQLLEEELRDSLKLEQELNELKSRFISVVSHEFRTPMALIFSSAQMLRLYGDRIAAEKRLDHLDRIEAQIILLTHLVENVLSVGRVQTQRLEVHLSLTNLEELCQTVAADVERMTMSHRILFLREGECEHVHMDKHLIRLLLNNLLINAVKYSPQADKVIFQLLCSQEVITIRVQDFGIGIPETDLPRLFEPYFRAENVQEITGTGIGLTLVQEIVNLSGGSIDVESTLGVGTTFIVQLPTVYSPSPS